MDIKTLDDCAVAGRMLEINSDTIAKAFGIPLESDDLRKLTLAKADKNVAMMWDIYNKTRDDTVMVKALQAIEAWCVDTLATAQGSEEIAMMCEAYNNAPAESAIKLAAYQSIEAWCVNRLAVAQKGRNVDLMREVHDNAPFESPFKTNALQAMLALAKENKNVGMMWEVYRRALSGGIVTTEAAEAAQAVEDWCIEMLAIAKKDRNTDMMLGIYNTSRRDSLVRTEALQAVLAVAQEDEDVVLMRNICNNGGEIVTETIQAMLVVAQEREDIDLMWEVNRRATDGTPIEIEALQAINTWCTRTFARAKAMGNTELMRDAYKMAPAGSTVEAEILKELVLLL